MGSALSTHSQTSTIAAFVAEKVMLNPRTIEYVTTKMGARLRGAYCKMEAFFTRHDIKFIPAYCGMFVFARLCETEDLRDEKEFHNCLQSAGVSLSTGTSYHFKEPGWFRICYGIQNERLDEGLARIERILGDFKFQKRNENSTSN